jgi:hypothetical protein
MQSGQSRSRRWHLGLLAAGLSLAGCCTLHQAHLQKALLADRNPAAHCASLEARYAVQCPDMLELRVETRPDWCGPRPVEADGCVALGRGERLRVEGLPVPEITRALARLAGVPSGQVSVRVAEYKSQHLYVFGEVNGVQRAVPYRGPETVLELLQRVGGITPGAALGEVRVVRAHVADGKPPELFTIDLSRIVLKRDQQTNVELEPFDQIHVGESSRWRLAECVPPWLRPVYLAVLGMKPAAGRAEGATSSPPSAPATARAPRPGPSGWSAATSAAPPAP